MLGRREVEPSNSGAGGQIATQCGEEGGPTFALFTYGTICSQLDGHETETDMLGALFLLT